MADVIKYKKNHLMEGGKTFPREKLDKILTLKKDLYEAINDFLEYVGSHGSAKIYQCNFPQDTEINFKWTCDDGTPYEVIPE